MIDEASAQMMHLELNSAGATAPEAETKAQETGKGQLFHVACSLDLVSCFMLSRDEAEQIVTDGSKDPIVLFVSDDGSESLSASGNHNAPSAFLQITPDIAYPLGLQVPCLRPQPGYYVLMLPDLHYYGIVFPEGYPQEALNKFENELAKYCMLCEQLPTGEIVEVKPSYGDSERPVEVTTAGGEAGKEVAILGDAAEAPKGYLSSFADSITTGADYVTWGIRSTSNFLRSGIENTGSAISSKIYVQDANTHVPSPIAGSVGFVKSVTPGVVYVSGSAAAALTSVASYIGSTIGSVLPKMTSDENGQVDPNSTGAGLRSVGVASARAVLNIWSELSDVGQNLIDGTQKASVQVVQARYGDQMGKLTSDFIGIGSDAYRVKRNIASIGVKPLAKAAIKTAGNQLVEKQVGKTGAERTKAVAIHSPPSATPQAKSSAAIAQAELLDRLRHAQGVTSPQRATVLIDNKPHNPQPKTE